MTNTQYPIGSIAWLEAMKADFHLNNGKPAPEPVKLPPLIALNGLHSEFGDIANATQRLAQTLGDIQAQVEVARGELSTLVDQVADLRSRLDLAKRN